MSTLPREDFPTLPEAQGTGVPIPRSALREMIAKTQFAITGEDTRYYLNGALIVLKGKQMTMVATDGHRLALVNVDRDAASPAERRAIIPKKTLGELSRLLTEGDGDVYYELGENHQFFQVGERLLISRINEGQFPAYERVIPKGNDKKIEFERDRLTSAVKRVALLSNERSRAVKFDIVAGQGRNLVEQPGVRRSARAADRWTTADPRCRSASTRSTSPSSSTSSRPTPSSSN